MPCINLPFDPTIGPLIPIGISAPLSLAQPGAVPLPVRVVQGLVDTGCSNLAISPATAAALGLPIIGKASVVSSTQTAPANVYLGDLHIPFLTGGTASRHSFADVRFLDFLHPDPNFDALIGRDVFSMGTLIVNGQTRQFTFCW